MSDNTYTPDPPPHDVNDLPEYVYRQLQRIADAMNNRQVINLQETNVAPTRPQDGDIRKADGTNWQASEGIYAYYNSTWTKL